LTAAITTVVSLDAIHGELDMNVKLSREKFNELNQHFFRRCIEVLDKVLLDAGISKNTIDEIVLVGGSSKIPCVQEMIKRHFNNKLLSRVLRADEAVAYGAALHASTMTQNETPGYSFKDVYPLPIGVKVKMVDGRDFSTVLPKNSPIPCSATKTYYTVQNDQPAVKIAIYEGEEPLVCNNFSLGDFEMGLPPHTPKDTCFTVRMSLDEDGILHVKSEDPTSKTQRQLVVNETKGRLSQKDIENFKMEELDFYTFSS
jgi:L1 cell adhesion molecule like protein